MAWFMAQDDEHAILEVGRRLFRLRVCGRKMRGPEMEPRTALFRLLIAGLVVSGLSFGLGYLGVLTLPVGVALLLASTFAAASLVHRRRGLPSLGTRAAVAVAISFCASSVIACALASSPKWYPLAGAAFLSLTVYLWWGARGLDRTRAWWRVAPLLLFAVLPLVFMRMTSVAPSVRAGSAVHSRLLLLLGADPNVRNQHEPLLATAVGAGRLDLARLLLLDFGADPNATNDDSWARQPVLFVAARDADPGLLRLLLARGARPDARNNYGETALFHANRFGRAENARLLLQAGADPSIRNDQGETAADQH